MFSISPTVFLKMLLVDPLMNIADRPAALAIGGGIGIVDMPGAIGLRALEVGEDLKIPRQGADVVAKLHGVMLTHVRG